MKEYDEEGNVIKEKTELKEEEKNIFKKIKEHYEKQTN